MKVLRGTFTGKSGQHKILLGFSKYNLSFGARKNNLQKKKKNTGEMVRSVSMRKCHVNENDLFNFLLHSIFH
jgi:hypothetical protein